MLLRRITLHVQTQNWFAVLIDFLIVVAQLPMYRERVRAVIPIDVQDQMWAHCWQVKGRQQTLVADCVGDIGNAEAAEIIDAIKQEADILGHLNFWLSTVSVVLRTIPDQEAQARATVEMLDAYLATRHQFNQQALR